MLAAIALVFVLMVAGKMFSEWRASIIAGAVYDEYSKAPLSGALVQWNNVETRTDRKGEFTLIGVDKSLHDTPLVISSDDYAPQALATDKDNIVALLRPDVLSGRVTSEDGAPIPNVRVATGEDISVETDQDGQFRLKGVPRDFTLRVVAPGHRVFTMQPGKERRVEIRLEQMVIRGLYISFGTNTLPNNRNEIVNKAKAAGLNAIVLDIKNDQGYVTKDVATQESAQIGASLELPERLKITVENLKRMGFYVIARLVVFKDSLYVDAHPDLAIMTARGLPYVDCEDQRWLDPFTQMSREYNLGLAENAAKIGFDEIHFDYMRFPSDCIRDRLVYSQEATPENQQEAIEGFLAQASSRLHTLGVTTSVALFGLTTVEDDIGIGQMITGIARNVDYVSPMVYPSTWRTGSFNSDYPPAEPYRIVLKSVQRAVERLKGSPAQVRPWLQAFHDYGSRGIAYNWPEIETQIKASQEAGAIGWTLWNPAGRYALDGPLP